MPAHSPTFRLPRRTFHARSRPFVRFSRPPGSPILLPSFLAHWRAASGLAGGVARIFMLNEICARISLQVSECQVPSPARARISLQGSGCQVPSPARGGVQAHESARRAASGLAGGVARIFLLNEICARISLQGSGCRVPSPARGGVQAHGSARRAASGLAEALLGFSC